jgi:hypothetical protein
VTFGARRPKVCSESFSTAALRRVLRKLNPPALPATNQPDGQITKTLSIPPRKNILLSSSGKSVASIGASRPIRGALRTSRTLRWDAVDAGSARDECRHRGRRSRVVLTPRRWRQAFEKFSEVTVAKEPGHRGEREVSRKPSRREGRCCSGSPVVLPPCFFICTGPMGATGTRLSLRPLFSERVERHARLGHVVPRG